MRFCPQGDDEDGVFSLDSAKTLKQPFEISDKNFHVVEGVGHIPMLERGEEVGRIVEEFLCSHSLVVEGHERHRNESEESSDTGSKVDS